MRQSDPSPNGRQKRLTCPRTSQTLSWLPAAVLAAGLTSGAFAQEVQHKNAKNEIPFGEVRIILETNATDCDVGLQLFFDGEPWRKVKVANPSGRTILDVAARGNLSFFGLTEQFNESNEPVMEELVEGFPDLECDEPEFSLEELFFLFPAGTHEFEGRTVEGVKLEGEATLSHVIPAPAELLGPPDDVAQDPNDTLIEWKRVDEPILPGFGRAPSDGVEIVGFHVVVEREAVAGVPAPLLVFTADLSADDTKVTVPPEFLQPNASYKFEVLQIDVSGNQTIAEREFATKP
jgi:hypothetical protein